MKQWAVRIRTYEDQKNYHDDTVKVIAGNPKLAITMAYRKLNDPEHYHKVLGCEEIAIVNR